MAKFSKRKDVEEKKTYDNEDRSKNGRSRGTKKRGTAKGKGRSVDRSSGTDRDGIGISYAGVSNDPSWYAASPALLRDAASLPYSNTLGVKVTLSMNEADSIYTTISSAGTEFRVPGVCLYKYMYGPGISVDNTSPINVATRNIYSFVNHRQSGAKNYEANDMGMYILGLSSIYNMWNFLVRIYGVAMTYSQKNRYLPMAVLRAMNVDGEDVLRHLSDLRYFINAMAKKVGVMCLPTTWPLVERHCMLNQGLYLDEPDEKAQITLFAPAGYYIYQEQTGAPGYLEFNSLYLKDSQTGEDILWTVSGLMGVVNNMMNNMVLSQDCNRISADIFKAYDGHVWKLEPIPEDYIVIPQYVPMVAMQMENSVALGEPKGSLDITQNGTTGAIEYSPQFYARPFCFLDRIINMHVDEVVPALNMEATRFMNIPTISEFTYVDGRVGNDYYELAYSGSEILFSFRIVTLTDPVIGNYAVHEYDSFPHFPNSGAGLIAMNVWAKDWAPFNNHPLLYVSLSGQNYATMAGSIFQEVCGELDNYAVIKEDVIRMMHETALLSELDVPLMGAKTSGRLKVE